MTLDEIKELTKRAELDQLSDLYFDVPHFIWIPEFISLAGSNLYDRADGRKPNDIDIIVRAKQEGDKFAITLDPALRLKIDRVLEERMKENAPVMWSASYYGPNWRYRPLWDLALIPHKPEIKEMNEPEFSSEFYKVGKINSPTFAYKAVYGKMPDTLLSGRTSEPKKIWNGIEVDSHLKEKWLEELNSIPEIELRASDEGKSKERVAFIVFRMKNPVKDEIAKNLAEKLNSIDGLYSLSDVGMGGRPRVVVAGKVKYGDNGWESWWDSLASKIKSILSKEFQKEMKKGLYLAEPHGELIWKGEKKLIVKARKFINEIDKPLVLISGDKAYGVIVLKKPRKINLKEFKILRWKHKISEEERKKWWPGKLYLYAYEFDFQKWNEPKEVRVPAGVQTLIRDVEFAKLHLKEFRSTGMDEDLKNPKEKYNELFADLRYLGNSAYPRLKRGEKWGEWTLEDVLRYFARIVDILRSIYFPLIPPKKITTAYWQCYKEAEEYMKSKPPKTEKEFTTWREKRRELGMINKSQTDDEFNILPVSKGAEERIVCGVVYEPDTIDTDGDYATADEIRNACYQFMEQVQTFKLQHQGQAVPSRILENYIAPQNFKINGEKIKKGTWLMTTRVLDDDIWKEIKSGEITGFSMHGSAKAIIERLRAT